MSTILTRPPAQNGNGYGFWTGLRQTCDLAVRTRREDWFAVVDLLAANMKGAGEILDIGCGDGHSTRQVLARLRDYQCDLLEPDEIGLRIAAQRMSEYSIRAMYSMPLETFLLDAPHYDAVMAMHTNYYWGTMQGGDAAAYFRTLEQLYSHADKIVLQTCGKKSAFYATAQNPLLFADWVHAESNVEYALKRGWNVEFTDCPMGFYIGDIFADKDAAIDVWQFIHDTERIPNTFELKLFMRQVDRQQKDGWLEMADQLIVIKK